MEKSEKALLDSYKRKSDWQLNYLNMLDLAERRLKSAKRVQKKIKQKFDELIRVKEDPAQLQLFNPDDFLADLKEQFKGDFDETFWEGFGD